MRLAVIGLGKMGLLHAALHQGRPGIEVVAAVDPSEPVRRMFAQLKPSMTLFPSTQELLAATPVDGVIIASPVSDHVPSALECLRRNIPFFIEKPLALSTSQARPLLEAVRSQRVVNMVGFMTRFIESFQRGKIIVDSGCLGPIQRVTGTIYVSQLFEHGKGWRYDKTIAGGGVLLSQGCHLLDLLTWYFGPIRQVNADILSVYTPPMEDFAHVMLDFQSGLKGWMDSSWSVRSKRTVQTTLDILGQNGALTISDDRLQLILDKAHGSFPQGPTVLQAPQLYKGVAIDVGGPQYTLEGQAFTDAIQSGTMPQPNVEQAYHVQAVIDAAYASAQEAGAPKKVEA